MRSPRILVATVGAGLVTFDPDADNCFELNDIAADVVRRLEKPTTFEDLRVQVLANYDVTPEQCARDLRELLEELQSEGLVESHFGPIDPAQPAAPKALEVEAHCTHRTRIHPIEAELPYGRLSCEFQLCIECCKFAFVSHDLKMVRELAQRADWSRFLVLARHHRIQGIAWNCLSDLEEMVPNETGQALFAEATEIAADNLRASADCRALLKTFDAAKIPLVFLKGLTLGSLAYSNPSLKAAIDIDLLIDPADLGKAARLLRDCGYRLVAPANHEVLNAWHRGWKESVWTKDSPPLQIDLHTRTADNRHLIPDINVHSPRHWVDIGDSIRLPTLADDELFAYLAVHGASSAWFRLKWISDFAALVQGRGAVEIEHLYRRSQELGAGRAAGQALLLADELFGVLEQSPALRGELARDRATQRLYRAALRLLTDEPREPTERRWGTMTIHWTQFLLLPGLSYKISELSRQAGRLHSRRDA